MTFLFLNQTKVYPQNLWNFMFEHLTVVSDYLKSNNINVDGSFGLCLHSFAVTLSISMCGVLFLNLKF